MSERNSPPPLIAGDPLRAVAALTVLGYHAAYFSLISLHAGWFDTAYGPVAGRLIGGLHLGLFVFFVLSGYLISGPFVRAFIAGTPAPRLGSYIRNRLLRIVPAFWAGVTLVLLCWGTMGASPGKLLAVYGFAQNFVGSDITKVIGQAWTLDVEIAFYALVPIAALLMAQACRPSTARHRRRLLFAGLLAAGAVSLAARALAPAASAWQGNVLTMLFAFIPGIALAGAETTQLPARLRARGSGRPARAVLIAGLLLVAAYFVRGSSVTPEFTRPMNAALAALASGTVVAGVLIYQWSMGRAWRPLDNPVMRWVGARSYSLYVLHQPVIVAIAFSPTALSPSPSARLAEVLPISLAVSLAGAAVWYRYIERPFNRRRSASRSLAPCLAVGEMDQRPATASGRAVGQPAAAA